MFDMLAVQRNANYFSHLSAVHGDERWLVHAEEKSVNRRLQLPQLPQLYRNFFRLRASICEVYATGQDGPPAARARLPGN